MLCKYRKTTLATYAKEKDPSICWIKLLPFCGNYCFQESTKERRVQTRRAMQCDSAITSLASGSSTVPKFCCTRRADQLTSHKPKGLLLPGSLNAKTVTHTQAVAKSSVSDAVSPSSDESLNDYRCQFPSSFCQALQASNTMTTKQLVGFCREQGSPKWCAHLREYASQPTGAVGITYLSEC